MRVFTAALAVSLVVPLSTLSAQQPPSVGQRVRVNAPDCGIDKQATTFQSLGGETLVLDTMECPLASVKRLEVIRGKRGHAVRGMLIGLVIGAGGGSIAGSTAACSDCGPAVLAWGVLGGAVGLVSGLVVGAFVKTDRWEEVPLDRLRVSFAPRHDGFAFGMRVAF